MLSVTRVITDNAKIQIVSNFMHYRAPTICIRLTYMLIIIATGEAFTWLHVVGAVMTYLYTFFLKNAKFNIIRKGAKVASSKDTKRDEQRPYRELTTN